MHIDLPSLERYRRDILAAVFCVRRLQTRKQQHLTNQKILGILTNLRLLVAKCSQAERKLDHVEPESRQLAS
jgi:hypothetical protein